MTFISYAQNFEDLMLWRALRNVKNGFYIDVGAAWPDEHSVTRWFHDHGWRGINIEPNPKFYEQLQSRRATDINLDVAVSDTPGFLSMNFFNDTGLSTLDDQIAKKHTLLGWKVDKQQVEVTTLAAIWKDYIPSEQDVHFLKVDAEGSEGAVLRGNDWINCRPWIVVVESTLPMTQEESYAAWECQLLEANYYFCYADGLNRFYVAEEHIDLANSFAYPPNVFDDFVLAAQVDADALANEANQRAKVAEAQAAQANERASLAEAQAAQANERASLAEAQAAQANERASLAEAQAAQAKQTAAEIDRQYNAVINSRSWRLTKPLRLAGTFARWFYRGAKAWLTFAPGSRPRRAVKKILIRMMNTVNGNAALKRKAIIWLNKSPKLKQRLKNIASAQRLGEPHPSSSQPTHAHMPGTPQLSPRARQIYMSLKNAIEKSEKELK